MPYSSAARFKHSRQIPPGRFVPGTFRNVPLSHTKYHGHKYGGRGSEAIVGRLKGDGWAVQSILTPKRRR